MRRLSPNVWNVGDIVRVGGVTFRAAVVYPTVLFEAVDDADLQGPPEEESDPMPLCDCEWCARPLRDHDEEESG